MNTSMKILFFILILSCANDTENIECIECGGGILDGYLYKEVSLSDIANLADILPTATIGNCIRFKMDGEDFSSAEIVDDCCCNLYD